MFNKKSVSERRKKEKKKKEEGKKKLYEAGRVVIAGGLGISKGLQDRVGIEELVLDTVHLCAAATDSGNVLHDDLGRLGLAGTTLTSNNDTLVNVAIPHAAVSIISDGEP